MKKKTTRKSYKFVSHQTSRRKLWCCNLNVVDAKISLNTHTKKTNCKNDKLNCSINFLRLLKKCKKWKRKSQNSRKYCNIYV